MRQMIAAIAGGVLALSATAALNTAARAAEPASCKLVRFSDIGWTDVTATTALTSALLSNLGYTTKITVLSVPVTYQSLKNKDIDVFLGNWMPSMEADRKPFTDDHSIDVMGANLTGAKYTLAVPDYVYDSGLHDFADLAKFGDALHNKVYGIEPGNDGNRHVLDMIRDNANGLGKFELVESSEQGMLAEVERDVRTRKPIVFLGWEPHPMNTMFHMKYLTGGDSTFGPDFGGATVFTNTRAGYAAECPNVGKLLSNLHFALDAEDTMMGSILQEHAEPDAAVGAWMKAHPEAVRAWLSGVTTFDGQPGEAAVMAKIAG